MRSSATRWKRRFVSVLQLTDIETRGDLPQGKRLENSSEQDFFSFLFFVLGLSLIFCFLCNVFMGPPPPSLTSLLISKRNRQSEFPTQPTKASQLLSSTVSLSYCGNRCMELWFQPITSNQIDDLGVVGLRHPIAVNLKEEMVNKHKIS